MFTYDNTADADQIAGLLGATNSMLAASMQPVAPVQTGKRGLFGMFKKS